MSEKKEDGLLQIATRVKTPLSLVSLVVLVLYGLYKLVLGLPVFSILPANSTFLLLNNIVDKVFYLAVLALVLGIIAFVWVQVLTHRSNSPVSTSSSRQIDTSELKEDLRLVDVSILEDSPLPRLDFKLRNIGTQVAFLKRAEFKVLDIGEILSCDRYIAPITGALSVPSAVYDIELSPELKGMSRSINISQYLASNDIDRFQFVIHQGWDYPRDAEIECRWYYLKVVLVYNDTNQTVQTKPILLKLESSPPRNGAWTSVERTLEPSCIAHNEEVIRAMAKLEAIRSPSVESAISTVFGSKHQS